MRKNTREKTSSKKQDEDTRAKKHRRIYKVGETMKNTYVRRNTAEETRWKKHVRTNTGDETCGKTHVRINMCEETLEKKHE